MSVETLEVSGRLNLNAARTNYEGTESFKAEINPLTWYLQDIGRFPLLNKEQEQILFKAIGSGKTIAEIRKNQKFLATISKNLKEKFDNTLKDCNSIEDLVIKCNLRLVVAVAKEFQNKGLPLSDLIQEGNFGLVHAIEKFDIRRKRKFSTYAVWWIFQTVTRAIMEKGRTIRLPPHQHERLQKITKAIEPLVQELERQPTFDEIAKFAKISQDKVATALRVPNTFSLATVVWDESESDLSSIIADKKQNTEEEVEGRILKKIIATMLASLSPRERRVIEERFGTKDGRAKTLEEVGRQLGVTRERARQIEAKALRILNNPQNRQKLEGYV